MTSIDADDVYEPEAEAEATGDLWEAVYRAVCDMSGVPRARHADIGKNTAIPIAFVNIDDLLLHVKPFLAAQGLFVMQPVGSTPDGKITVRTEIRARWGEVAVSDTLALPSGGGGQASGSQITYMRRYSLQSFLGLPTYDDDGGAAEAARRAALADASRTQGATPAPSGPPSRTHEEPAIREALNKLSATDARTVRDHFKDKFGSNLSGLDPARHAEAWTWVQDVVAKLAEPGDPYTDVPPPSG